MQRGNVKLIALAVLVFGSMIGLIVLGMSNPQGLLHYLTIEELQSHPERAEQTFRIAGRVIPGTIERVALAGGGSFKMEDAPRDAYGQLIPLDGPPQTIQITFTEPPPDTLVDRADVVVEGKLLSSGVFAATKVEAKCPSKYEAADEGAASYGEY